MEINLWSIEKSDQIVVWSSDDDQAGLGHVRSTYTCTFCKRGFSNAQALGGHMNIHRKDRAKLKESSNETLVLLPEDMAKKNPSREDDDKHSLQLKSSEEKSCSPIRPCIFSSRDQDDAISTSSKDGTGDLVEKSLRLTELDLELRLGPEPHRPHISMVGTKEFF